MTPNEEKLWLAVFGASFVYRWHTSTREETTDEVTSYAMQQAMAAVESANRVLDNENKAHAVWIRKARGLLRGE